MERTNQVRAQRGQLADLIERRAEDIIGRWLDRVRADAAAGHVALTELRDGIHDYLKRLAELLRGGQSLGGVGTSAWSDVAYEHAVTRVRLGFDISQLFHELVALRRITTGILREEAALGIEEVEQISELVDAAVGASLVSYVDFRDYMTRRAEAEHIGFLTHELKNPLGAALLATEQLAQDDALSPEQRRLCAILERNVARMRRMIEDTLLTERLQIGEVEHRPVDVTLGQLLGDAIEQFERIAKGKQIGLSARYDPNLVVRADPALTLSATENLLDNAIKYTDVGQVTLKVEDGDDDVAFHVRDNCGGLSPEELRVIFEPFKRVHTRKPGSGLGLAIARRAIETQGGKIYAESSAETGCHFWFTLPKTHH